MQVSVNQREIWAFMKVYADQLAELFQPQNCVPNSMVNGPLQRLNDFAKLFDYATALAEIPSYRKLEKRDVAIDLTRDEVFKLMRSAAQELAAGLETPYRIDTGAAIKRLNELQAVMPPYVRPSNSDEG
jgi:hypothetical protein